MWKETDKKLLIVIFVAIVLLFASIFILVPDVKGDTLTYLETLEFLRTGNAPDGFTPNRIITTFGGLSIVMFFSKIFGSDLVVWFIMNILFYFAFVYFFYKTSKLLFSDDKIALITSLFVVGNYAVLTFGLNYLMDMGGWAFYSASLFFILKYAKFLKSNDLLIASAIVGVGALFKEYSLLGILPIATFLIYENNKSILDLIKKSVLPSFLAVSPIVALYIFVYLKFDYTYADWITDSYKYDYSSNLVLRCLEYIKSLGSLYNIFAIFVLGGAWFLFKEYRFLSKRDLIFLTGSVLSFLPVFLWGGITQRILFITVPATALISGYFFKKHWNFYPIYYVSFVIYLVLNFLMDSVLLNSINLPF